MSDRRYVFSADPLFFATAALIVLVDSAEYLFILLLSVLVHEGGHLTAMQAQHVPVSAVRLQPFGVGITPGGCMSKREEAVVAAAGPAVNLLIAGGLWAVSRVVKTGDFLRVLACVNMMLGLVNLMPAQPLDGGRILHCIVATRYGTVAAEKAVSTVGMVTGAAFTGLGLFVLWKTGLNISFAAVGLFLLTAAVLKAIKGKGTEDDWRKVGKNPGKGPKTRTICGRRKKLHDENRREHKICNVLSRHV